jgi:hypothetical protein
MIQFDNYLIHTQNENLLKTNFNFIVKIKLYFRCFSLSGVSDVTSEVTNPYF